MNEATNHPASGKARIGSLFAILHSWPGLPEPGRPAMHARLAHVVALVVATLSVAGCATGRIDYTYGKWGVCEVHHQTMQKAIVPAYYGLMPVTPRDEAMDSIRSKTFPHAEDHLNPGCDPRGPREAVVYSCSECVRVRHLWEADYDAKH
jgi:hypothetical protein